MEKAPAGGNLLLLFFFEGAQGPPGTPTGIEVHSKTVHVILGPCHVGDTRTRTRTAQEPLGTREAHKGPAHKGSAGPTRVQLTRAQAIVASWQDHRARAKATT